MQFRDGVAPDGPIILSEMVTARELAEKLNVTAKDLLGLLIQKGMMVTTNQALPHELAEEIYAQLSLEESITGAAQSETSRAPAPSRPWWGALGWRLALPALSAAAALVLILPELDRGGEELSPTFRGSGSEVIHVFATAVSGHHVNSFNSPQQYIKTDKAENDQNKSVL